MKIILPKAIFFTLLIILCACGQESNGDESGIIPNHQVDKQLEESTLVISQKYSTNYTPDSLINWLRTEPDPNITNALIWVLGATKSDKALCVLGCSIFENQHRRESCGLYDKLSKNLNRRVSVTGKVLNTYYYHVMEGGTDQLFADMSRLWEKDKLKCACNCD
jgi:hypothetical protein